MSHSPPLLGLDHFMLALEQNDTSIGTSGHTCRYILELNGNFDVDIFKQTLEKNEVAQWLSSLYIETGSKNKWSIQSNNSIKIEEFESDELLPSSLTQTFLHKDKAPLFYFSILRKKNKNVNLILSWHHLLMDGYGAVLFLENLIKPIQLQETLRNKSPFNLSTLKECIKAKQFVDSTSKGDIEMMEDVFASQVKQNFKFISFTQEETKKIEINAKKYGALFGLSTYLLACSSIAVAQHFSRKKKQIIKDFWVPVPQDTRKKGSKWPITGNHLSFLFYRIRSQNYTDKKAMTMDLNNQMLEQIKNKIPSAYSHLMNYMRHLPTSLYAKLIKGPNGKSLSSFLFTVAAEHPKTLDQINGCKIINAFSVPPNTYPPGLTFAFNRFQDKIQLVIPYYEHLFSKEEMCIIEEEICKELLND